MKSRTAASEAREAEADVSEKAWEAGPRREVPAARGVAAHPCDDLPGPGQRVTWVGDRNEGQRELACESAFHWWVDHSQLD